MSMALKYRAKKMAGGGAVGDDILKKRQKGINRPNRDSAGYNQGISEAGAGVRHASEFREGGQEGRAKEFESGAKEHHKKTLEEMKAMRGMNRQNLAEGGEVCSACEGGVCGEHGGTVGRIMAKRMSQGGMVANDTPPKADFEDADYDVLATDDTLEEHYTGDNSGDEDGGLSMDDPVDRIMMKRRKQSNPRPA